MSDDNQNNEEESEGRDEDILEEQPLPSQEDILEGLPEIPQDISLDEQMSNMARKPGRFKKEDIEKAIKFGSIGVALLLVIMMVYSCQPKEGPAGYAICSTFLELTSDYPHTLEFNDVEFSRTAVRIYFSSIDPFGEFKHEMIECTFAPDEETGMRLAEVKRNRNTIDQQEIREFNQSLKYIDKSKMYRVLPPEWENQWRLE